MNTKCGNCRMYFDQSARGRPKIYCSEQCRRQAGKNRKPITECARCSNPIQKDYNAQKYCQACREIVKSPHLCTECGNTISEDRAHKDYYCTYECLRAAFKKAPKRICKHCGNTLTLRKKIDGRYPWRLRLPWNYCDADCQWEAQLTKLPKRERERLIRCADLIVKEMNTLHGRQSRKSPTRRREMAMILRIKRMISRDGHEADIYEAASHRWVYIQLPDVHMPKEWVR